MKIVSGMQGTRNQEISSENKDGKKKNHQKRRDIPTKRRQEEQGKKTKERNRVKKAQLPQ